MNTIRDVRVKQDLSQAALAARSGVSIPAISRLECGHPVQKTTLLLLCHALNIDASEVTGVNVYSAVQSIAARKKKLHQ